MNNPKLNFRTLSLSFACLLFLTQASCITNSSKLDPLKETENLSIPGQLSLSVEPVVVVADLERSLYMKLCNPHIHSWPDRPIQINSGRSILECGSDMRCTEVIAPWSRSGNEKITLAMQVGQKELTLLPSADIRQQIISELSGISGVNILNYRPKSAGDGYILRSRVSGIAEGLEDKSGFGISGFPIVSVFSVGLSMFSPEKTKKVANIRIDSEVIDPSSGAVLLAFTSIGTQKGSFVSNTLFTGITSEPFSFFNGLFSGASRAAAREVATQLASSSENLLRSNKNPQQIYIIPELQMSNPKPSSSPYCSNYEGPENIIESAFVTALSSVSGFTVVRQLDSGKKVGLPKGSKYYRLVISLTENSAQISRDSKSFGNTILDPSQSLGKTLADVALMVPLFWINQATLLPTSFEKKFEQSAIGIDLALIDDATGVVLTSFPVYGTYAEASASASGLAGVSNTNQAASLADAAIAIAALDGAEKIRNYLRK